MIRTRNTRTDDFNYAVDEPRKRGDVTSESLAEQTAAFLAAGGKIQQIPAGISKDTPIAYQHSLGTLSKRGQREKNKYSVRRERRIDRAPARARKLQEYACKGCGDADPGNRYQNSFQCLPCYRVYWRERCGKGKRPQESL